MTDQPSAGPTQPAGFYPDSSGTMRFWDGSQWTDHTQAAPKKKHTVRNVLIGIFVLIALTFVGCTALVGSAVNEVDKAVKAEEAKDEAPGGPNNPLEITEGEAFSVLGFDYSAGWKVEKPEFGSVDISGLKVTNNREERDGAVVDIKFLKGTEALAVLSCTTEQIPVGQTTSLSCLTGDEFPTGYDSITINDTF